MKPVSPVIPGMDLVEIVWAKDQPPYNPLATVVVDHGVRTISHWKLTWRERLRIFFTGDLWHTQLNFGMALQPILMETENPRCYLHYEDAMTAGTDNKAEESLADA